MYAGAGGVVRPILDFRRGGWRLEPDVYYLITLTKVPGCSLTHELILAHVAHLKQLEDAGRLVICGPFADGAGGMAVIQAESEEAARTIAEADPFVASGAETYTLRTFQRSSRENNHMGYGD